MLGVGKSTLLVNLFIEHIRQGHGGLFIDPHGDTADQIARLIPKSRMRDFIWIDPDPTHVSGINIFDYSDPKDKELGVESFQTMMKAIDGTAWGDETARVFGTLLAESRIYGITLVLAAQGMHQPPFAKDVFSNCPTQIVFNVSGADAQAIMCGSAAIESKFLEALSPYLPAPQRATLRIGNWRNLTRRREMARNAEMAKTAETKSRGLYLCAELRRIIHRQGNLLCR